MNKKDQIKELLIPLIGQGLTQRIDAKVVSEQAKRVLSGAGITVDDVKVNFTFDEIDLIRQEYKIPAIATPWLKEFYDSLTRQTAPSTQSTASPA